MRPTPHNVGARRPLIATVVVMATGSATSIPRRHVYRCNDLLQHYCSPVFEPVLRRINNKRHVAALSLRNENRAETTTIRLRSLLFIHVMEYTLVHASWKDAKPPWGYAIPRRD